MTSNLLSLNSPKTEFVLIGLKMHAAGKDSQLFDFNRHYSVCSQPWLHFWWTSLILPPDLCNCLYPATITSAIFAVSVPTLTFTPPKRLPQHASPHLWNQLPIHHSGFLIQILLFIPLSATIIWTCRFNLLNSKVCYHLPSLFHCFTLSSKLKDYLFRKSYPLL